MKKCTYCGNKINLFQSIHKECKKKKIKEEEQQIGIPLILNKLKSFNSNSNLNVFFRRSK